MLRSRESPQHLIQRLFLWPISTTTTAASALASSSTHRRWYPQLHPAVPPGFCAPRHGRRHTGPRRLLLRILWEPPSVDSRRIQKSACPCLEDSPPFGGLDLCVLGGMTTLNILSYQTSGGFHYTCTRCCLCPWSRNRNPNILLSARLS